MSIPYIPLFLVLLVAYGVYSVWAGLDPRYLIAGALALLVGTAIVDAAGAVDAANTLAEFVFFLLVGGVMLLLLDHLHAGAGPQRDSGTNSGLRAWEPHAPDLTDPGQGSPEQSLDRSE